MSDFADVVAWADLTARPEDEWSRDRSWLSISRTSHASNTLLVTSKDLILRADIINLPDDWACCILRLPNDCGLSPVSALAPNVQRIGIVGDLDPIDLLSFCLVQKAFPSAKVTLLGVTSQWLHDSTPGRAGGLPLRSIRIKMGSFESGLWTQLRTKAPWERLIGVAALQVLESGAKIELDGLVNPAASSPAYRQWVGSHVCAFVGESSP
jgi:hypothetical protein